MLSFQVADMTCGHCASKITEAVKAIDPEALVAVDLATHRVSIQPASAGAEDLGDAIERAGYTPIAIENPAGSTVAAASAPRKGCCCG